MTLTAPACPVAGEMPLGRERGQRRPRRRRREGQYGVRSALGPKPHVRRSARRARHVVSGGTGLRHRAGPPSSAADIVPRQTRSRPQGPDGWTLARDAKRSSRLNDPRMRELFYQALLLVCVGALVCGAVYNAAINMQARGIPMGFGFWNQVAGFEINLHLIGYSALSTYGRAFWVGLLNTLLIARHQHSAGDAAGLCDRRRAAFAQLAAVAIRARLHQHAPQHAAAPATAVLVQCGPEVSARTAPVDQHRRGRFSQQPRPLSADARSRGRRPSGSPARFVAAVAAAVAISRLGAAAARAHRRASADCAYRLGAAHRAAGDCVAAAGARRSRSTSRDFPASISKVGCQVIPEMAALVFGLVTFTAAFIAEIVRAGVLAVPHGQSEAAGALGLHRGLR